MGGSDGRWIVAGSVAGFAIYTWGWRNGGAGEKARAQAYSLEVVAFVHRFQDEPPGWHADKVTDGVWMLRLNGVKGRGRMCFTMNLEQFAPRPAGTHLFNSFYALGQASCE